MTLLRSFSVKMALGYVAIFTLSALILYAIIYAYSVYFPMQDLRRSLFKEMITLEQVYAVQGQTGLIDALNTRASRPDEHSAMHAFIRSDGEALSANIQSWPRYSGSAWLRLEADTYAAGLEIDRLGLMLDRRFADGSRLLLGRDIDAIDEIEENLQEAALWFGTASMLLSMIGSILLRRTISARLRRISDVASQVMQGDLSERIVMDGSHDEFDRLSQTLNNMLDRIDLLIESVRRVSDNVAHELRTPLTRMLAEIEAFDGEAETVPVTRLDAIAEEAYRLQRIFDALLRISRLESGRHELALRNVDPVAICADVSEYYGPAVDAAGGSISLEAQGNYTVRADADLLFQAVANMVDNALKYGGSLARIRLHVGGENGKVIVTVIDFGPGFDSDDLDKCTERFYRGTNAAGQVGEGLGLAVVQTIAKVHGASFAIARVGERTEARLIFP